MKRIHCLTLLLLALAALTAGCSKQRGPKSLTPLPLPAGDPKAISMPMPQVPPPPPLPGRPLPTVDVGGGR
jgi:hypothetical protein